MRSLIPGCRARRALAVALGLGGVAAAVPVLGAGADLPNAQNVKVYDFGVGAHTPAARRGNDPVLSPRFGQRVTVTGRLGFYPSGRGLNGAVVQVVSPTNQVAAAALTNRNGRFVARWRAREIGAYRVTAVGVPQIQQVVTMTLRPRVLVRGRRRSAPAGHDILIRGSLAPAFAAPFVGTAHLQAQQRPSGGWQTVANGVVGADGNFALRFGAPSGGRRVMILRVVTPDSPTGWAAGISRGIRLAVR